MDDLAAWLENLECCDDEEHEHEQGGGDGQGRANPKINRNNALLYRCSHCGNTSAALRKCELGLVFFFLLNE